MKNLKKLISVVLCVAMLASFMVVGTSAATYGDVDESKAYYTDVELLSSLDILKGDGNGNFNPDAEIKRSEFAAVVCRALGAESAATSKVSTFDDVASEHWAVGYIAWAAGKGIVNGYGDGTFAPDKAVSYQEAIKMITAAMGYADLAETDAYKGYPWGYITLAGEYGITKGIDATYEAPASRAIVAQLVANALDAPLMFQKDTIYGRINVVYDGNEKGECDGEERTLLSYYLDVIKTKANVVDNYKTNSKLWKKNRDPKVALKDIKFVNVSDKDDYAEDYFTYVSGNLYKADVYEGATAAASYLGYDVYAYIMVNDDDALELKAIIADGKSVDTLEVTKDIETADVDAKGVVEFTYWEDIENDSKVTEVDVAADATIYVNGENVGTLDEDDEAIAAFEEAVDANSVLFIGPRGDDFEKVFITIYEYAIVDYVDLEEESIEFKDGYINLSKDERGDTFVYTLIKDGAEIELKDLAENDVLSIVAPGGDYEKSAYVDIYVSSKTVTGTVTGAKSGDNNHTYYIDKVEYKTVYANDLKVGDEGIFYLTADGKIIDSKATSTLSDNYAYILKAGEDTNFGESTYQLRLFTKEGTTATYNIASSVKVTWEVEGEVVTETLKADKDQQDELYDMIVEMLSDSETEAAANEKAADRLITYSLSGDEINKISFAAPNGKNGEDFNVKKAGTTYKAASSKFGGYYFNEASKLFYAPVELVTKVDDNDEEYEVYAIDADDVALLSFASLDEDQTYTAYAYAIDEKTMGASLIVNSLGFAGKATALAVVKSVAEGLNAENEAAVNITVLQGGQTATYAVDEDVDTLDAVVEGDIIQIVLNGAGEISQAEVVYNGALTDHAKNVTADESDIAFAAGWVVDGGNGELYLNDELTKDGADDYVFNYEAGCTLAMVDETKAGTSSYVKALTSTSAVKYIKSFDADGNPRGDLYYAVVRLVDDEIVDVVEYTGIDAQ